MVEVTQSARDAAAEYEYLEGMGPRQSRRLTAEEIRAGERDAYAIVQALTAAEARGHARSDAERAALVAEVAALRECLHAIDIEAGNTIPPDGGEAAFGALDCITRLINPFRIPFARAALAPVAELGGGG